MHERKARKQTCFKNTRKFQRLQLFDAYIEPNARKTVFAIMRFRLECAVAQDGEDPNMADIFPHLDYKPKLPQRMDHGIGIVGAGGIVNYAHLPAYKQVGFKVIGITDQNREKAERTAKEHSIEKVCVSVEELLRVPEVEIVDIAVYPAQQVSIVEQCTAAGKHLLCQKPFADEYATAVRSVELAKRAKVKIAVNQQ